MTARWVLTWKENPETGESEIRARVCVRGFLDAQAAVVATIAATASLLTHRLFAALAPTSRRILGSLDVSAAFLKGLSFEVLNEEAAPGSVRRAAYFTLPEEEDYQILLELDFTLFGLLATTFLNDVVCEVLKGGFGLKDAPRLWRLRLE